MLLGGYGYDRHVHWSHELSLSRMVHVTRDSCLVNSYPILSQAPGTPPGTVPLLIAASRRNGNYNDLIVRGKRARFIG